MPEDVPSVVQPIIFPGEHRKNPKHAVLNVSTHGDSAHLDWICVNGRSNPSASRIARINGMRVFGSIARDCVSHAR